MPRPETDRDSFGDFVTASLPALLRFGHVLTGRPDEAEDLVQEALAKSMRRWTPSVRRRFAWMPASCRWA